jgi:hypothetical protein
MSPRTDERETDGQLAVRSESISYRFRSEWSRRTKCRGSSWTIAVASAEPSEPLHRLLKSTCPTLSRVIGSFPSKTFQVQSYPQCIRRSRQPPSGSLPTFLTSSRRVVQNKLSRKARVRLQETGREVLATIPRQEDIKLKRKLRRLKAILCPKIANARDAFDFLLCRRFW